MGIYEEMKEKMKLLIDRNKEAVEKMAKYADISNLIVRKQEETDEKS